jgi:hypothetical protein
MTPPVCRSQSEWHQQSILHPFMLPCTVALHVWVCQFYLSPHRPYAGSQLV